MTLSSTAAPSAATPADAAGREGRRTGGRANRFRFRHYLRPSLRTVLLIVNLGIVVLPLGSIFFFRIYENQLINQTEAELISQAAFAAALFRQDVLARVPDPKTYGRAVEPMDFGDPNTPYYTPLEPQLDFARQDTLPLRPAGQPAPDGADPLAVDIGTRASVVLADAQKITLAGMKLLDFNGVAVAGRQELGQSFAHVAEVARALEGKYASVVRKRISNSPAPALSSISRGTGIRLFVALPILQDDRLWGVVYLSRTPKNVLKHMYAEREKVILAGVTIFVVSILIVVLTSYRISRPIHQLIERTKRASHGDTDAMRPLDRPGTKEVGLLSQSFAEMAQGLNARSKYIRDFAARVSHEFKTPLTSIQGACELLLDSGDDMPADKRRKFLENIVLDGRRLDRLVKRLLDLARADNLRPSEDVIAIGPALADVAARYVDRPIDLAVSMTEPARTKMSSETFETIASNLIENALQHGATRMAVDVETTPDGIDLTFADNGSGVSEANRSRIFTPFFTTRREEGGTGLGLDVVKSLLETHEGGIRLSQTAREGGASFVVTVKPAP